MQDMECESKPTGKMKKDNTPSMSNKYYHKHCYIKYNKDKEFKAVEIEKFDKLYQYLLKVHNLLSLDTRMIKRIQDLRNGTVSLKGGKQITRYKEGVDYSLMLDSYISSAQNIDYAIRSMDFKEKWNEFAYCFAIMENGINNIVANNKRVEYHKQQVETAKPSADISIQVKKKYNKVDSGDISEFL